MFQNLPYYSIDLETTGLDIERCQILQFSAIYENPKLQLPFETIPKFNRYIKHKFYMGEDYALWLNSEILYKLSQYKHSWSDDKKWQSEIRLTYDEVFKEFADWVGDIEEDMTEKNLYINPAGKNFSSFDLQFIKNALNSINDRFRIKFRHKAIDPGILYVTDEDETVPGLDKCLERAGITREKQKDGGIITHDALRDAYDVILLLRPFYNKINTI